MFIYFGHFRVMKLVWTIPLLLAGCLCKSLNNYLKLFLMILVGLSNADCQSRKYDQESFVCVCNANDCDTVMPVGDIDSSVAVVYTTGKDRGRLTRSSEFFGSQKCI